MKYNTWWSFVFNLGMFIMPSFTLISNKGMITHIIQVIDDKMTMLSLLLSDHFSSTTIQTNMDGSEKVVSNPCWTLLFMVQVYYINAKDCPNMRDIPSEHKWWLTSSAEYKLGISFGALFLSLFFPLFILFRFISLQHNNGRKNSNWRQR